MIEELIQKLKSRQLAYLREVQKEECRPTRDRVYIHTLECKINEISDVLHDIEELKLNTPSDVVQNWNLP